jgi:sugar/nucleoside kinase (ribokinase family)
MIGAGRLLVLGDVLDEVWVTPRSRLRIDAETEAEIVTLPGGAAASTAAWMAVAGGDVHFRGRVAAADVARHAGGLRDLGVNAELDGDTEARTGTAVLLLEDGRRTTLLQRGANARLSPDHVSDRDLMGIAIAHATGSSLIGHADAFGRLTARAHAYGARVSLQPGPAGTLEDVGVPAMLEAVSAVDILITGLDDARALTGAYAPDQVAAALAQLCDTVALTMGEHGSIVGHAGALEHVQSQRTSLVDGSGAEEAFAAGFLAGIASGQPAREAAERGARLAARAVQQLGGRPGGTA